jgi:hypothetical protein
MAKIPLNDSNRLSLAAPELAKEWDSERNAMQPDSIAVHTAAKRFWWKCSEGHSWQAIIRDRHRSGSRCPYCAGVFLTPDNSLERKFPEIAKLWHPSKNGNLRPCDVSHSSHKKVWWQCSEGHDWSAPPNRITKLNGNGCQRCAGNETIPLSVKAPHLREEWADTESFDSTPSSSKRLFVWKCTKGHPSWKASPGNRVWAKSGCPYCAGSVLLPENSLAARFPELAEEWSKANAQTPSEVLPFSHQKALWRCRSGHEWEAYTHNRITQYTGCPICSQGVSAPQLEIVEYIRSLVPSSKVIVSDRKELGDGLELDVWVPEFKFAIEYQGLYWHSFGAPKPKTGSAVRKYQRCHGLGIKLFTVFADEWEEKRPILESMWKHRLGLPPSKKVHARECDVIVVEDPESAKSFFGENHLDGHTNSSLVYGLVFEGESVGMVSLRRHFTGELEVARLAFKLGYHVVGGAGRLVSRLPRPLVSFSNNRVGSGDVYRSLGFKEITQSHGPGYFYTDYRKRYNRFRCRRINDPEVLKLYPTADLQNAAGLQAEKILGIKRPLYRIEDCGHRKWLLE